MTRDLIFSNARRLASLGYYRQALSLLREHSQKDLETLLLEGKILAQQGSYQAALATFQRGAEAAPDSVRVQAAVRGVQALVEKGNRPSRSVWRASALVVGPALLLVAALGGLYALGARRSAPAVVAQLPRQDVVTEIRSLLEQERQSAESDAPKAEDYTELLATILQQQREARAALRELAAVPNTQAAPSKELQQFVRDTQQTDAWLARRIKQLEQAGSRATHERPSAQMRADAQNAAGEEARQVALPPATGSLSAPTSAQGPSFGITAPGSQPSSGAGQRSIPQTP